MPFDAIDEAMLAELMEHGRITNQDLADRVGLSPSACLRRHRRLEARGVIRGYTAIVDPALVGLAVTVMVEIRLDNQSDEALREFEEAVARCPDVTSCHMMAGEADYLLRVVACDVPDYERIHREHLTRFPHATHVTSSFALRTVVERVGLSMHRPVHA